MHRITSLRPTAVALAIATTTALTGCGMLGGEESAEKSGSASATPSATSTAKSSSTPKDEASKAETDQEKPSKDEVTSGLKSFYDRTDTTDSYDHDRMATCVVDRGYDTLSATTLNALKDGDPNKVDKDDRAKYSAITLACASDELPSGSLPPLPSDIPTELPKLPTDVPTGVPTEMPS